MSDAERQARFRERRKKQFQDLREEVDRLRKLLQEKRASRPPSRAIARW
jgi:hypothetical protein